jgi:hypothetical protein
MSPRTIFIVMVESVCSSPVRNQAYAHHLRCTELSLLPFEHARTQPFTKTFVRIAGSIWNLNRVLPDSEAVSFVFAYYGSHHHLPGLGHVCSVLSSWRVCWSPHLNCEHPMFRLVFGLYVFNSLHTIFPLWPAFWNFNGSHEANLSLNNNGLCSNTVKCFAAKPKWAEWCFTCSKHSIAFSYETDIINDGSCFLTQQTCFGPEDNETNEVPCVLT